MVQECKTLFPGRVGGLYQQSEIMAAYFERVNAAEHEVFGIPRFLPRNVRQFAMQRGDVNFLDLSHLGEALDSEYFIIFSGSYLKGNVLDLLMDKRAVNIHAGVSPYFRGMSCNFWACFQNRPDLVGCTVHLLSKGLDSGPMLFHALPKAKPMDPFVLGMEAVKAAHLGVVHYIQEGSLNSLEPVPQDRRLEMKYTKGSEFTDEIVLSYMDKLATTDEIGKRLAERDESQFLRPFIST